MPLRAKHRWLLVAGACLALLSAGAQAQSDWMSFPSEDGVFEAAFPSTPKAYAERRVKNGVRAAGRLLGAGNERFFCYAGYTDYSKEDGEAVPAQLEKFRDDFITGLFATLLEEKSVGLPRAPMADLAARRFTAIGDERRYTSIIAV